MWDPMTLIPGCWVVGGSISFLHHMLDAQAAHWERPYSTTWNVMVKFSKYTFMWPAPGNIHGMNQLVILLWAANGSTATIHKDDGVCWIVLDCSTLCICVYMIALFQ
jgi:hypothetical protein